MNKVLGDCSIEFVDWTIRLVWPGEWKDCKVALVHEVPAQHELIVRFDGSNAYFVIRYDQATESLNVRKRSGDRTILHLEDRWSPIESVSSSVRSNYLVRLDSINNRLLWLKNPE